MFFKGSRYEKVENDIYIDEDGKERPYKRVRFIKDTPAFIEHTVKQGERLDLISYQYYKDPTKFWLICDANNTIDPNELETPGKRILIPPDIF
jgi:nucleoid-associated protein YgaU